MGKSPGRWIKTVLFGKKPSKSQHVAGKAKRGNEVASKARSADLVSNEPVISHPTLNAIVRSEREVENATTDDDSLMLKENQNVNLEASVSRDGVSDAEKQKSERSATIVQAAFRGYLARRAFRALKGIIRLQAVIRGHLVRRQAVASLYCMYGIVKLQAVFRGRKARISVIGEKMKTKSTSKTNSISNRIAKLTSNTFVLKLLAPSPAVLPLRLCYDSAEPNSAPSWLDRWSSSRFWKPARSIAPSKAQRKHANGESVRSKRSVRRIPPASFESSESEKPKRGIRKTAQTAENSQESPQSEFERVKRNLRRIRNSAPLDNSEVDVGKHKQSSEKKKEASALTPKLPEQENPEIEPAPIDCLAAIPSEVIENDDNQEVEQKPSEEKTEIPKAETESVVEEEEGKEETAAIANGQVEAREEPASNGGHKTGRKASNLAKQEQNSPTLPSYMAATESAKAKLKSQSSSSVSQDGFERSSSTRRHSLPSASSKLRQSSNGKAKTDKPNSSSREGKGMQAEWRR